METMSLDWNKLQADLKGFVYKRVKDKELTEDIVHDVFLTVHEKAPQLKDAGKAFGWIYQITRNKITDHYRKKLKVYQQIEADRQPAPPNFNDCVVGIIAELIPTLPDKYRLPLEMSEQQQMSQLDIASQLNLGYSATKTRIQRARQMLRDKIEQRIIVETDGYGNVTVCRDRSNCC